MGSPEFAVPSLDILHRSRHKIVSVVSNPDKRRGRRSKPVPTEVKKRALDLDLPVFDAENVRDESFLNHLKKLEADLFVVVAFRILPKRVLELPEHGSINLHASLLPKYRGAAPIHWAVINGEDETGCTVFFLNETVDTGNIIGRVKTEIGPMETTGDVYNRLKTIGANLLLKSVNDIAEGREEAQPQDHSEATPAPKLFKENTHIDFEANSMEVHNFIRGLNPFPVAWCSYGNKKMNVYKSKPGPDYPLKPGNMKLLDERLLAGCGKGAIELLEVQLPGTKRMSGKDFSNGYDISVSLT